MVERCCSLCAAQTRECPYLFVDQELMAEDLGWSRPLLVHGDETIHKDPLEAYSASWDLGRIKLGKYRLE